MKQFDIILATDQNGGIGINNKLPWQIKEDMLFFKNKTLTVDLPYQKNIVIMGRNTFESIGGILDGRINMVISQNYSSYNVSQNIYYFKSLHDALTYCNNVLININNIYVIGGGLLYNEAIHHPLLRYIYLTKINKEYTCDVFFNLQLLENKNKFNLIDSISFCPYDIKGQSMVNIEMYKYENIDLGELQYLNLLENTLKYGQKRETRNSITYSSFGGQIIFNLQNGFPLLTTKKTFLRGIFEEAKHLILLGNTNTNVLSEKGIKIWESNTSKEFINKMNLPYNERDIGPMYGFQIRHYNTEYHGMNDDYINKGLDQLVKCLQLLKEDPYNRRIIMTTYNPLQAEKGVLYPCHGIVIQFYIMMDNNRKQLCCHMYQRSCDTIAGLPFNIASYALIIHILVKLLGEEYDVGKLIISFGDIHIYDKPDHLEAVKLHLSRIPYKFPKLNISKEISNIDEINNIEFADLELKDYLSHPPIKVTMVA